LERAIWGLLVEGTYWTQNVKGNFFDKFYDYPLSWESISNYPETIKDKIISELQQLDLASKANANSYSEYIDSIAGKTLREMFFQKYPEKIWGIPIDKMTADWAPKRVNIYKKKTPFFNKQWTALGLNGAGAIYERISDNIKKLGGKIYLNSSIEKIDSSNDKINTIFTKKRKVNIGENDILISTIPLASLLKLLGHQSNLQYRGVMVFYLDCSKDSVLPNNISWQYYDSDKVYFTRITEPKQMGIKSHVETNTLIIVEAPYSCGDELDRKDEDIICKEIINQVVDVGLLKKYQVNDITMVKEKFVYPIQYKGYQKELARAEGIISRHSQLYSLGAGARFNYTDTQVLFKKAFDLVESLSKITGRSIQEIKKQSSMEFNQTIAINGREIGGNSQPYIIAEAGMNHNGDVSLGKKLIDSALNTGCDAIKFQTFLPTSRVSSKVKSTDFVELADGVEETMFDMFSRLSMSFSEQKELFDYAKELGVEIFSTPFDFESVDFLESLGVDMYKVASMDLVNLPLIEYIAKTNKPIILSTGMSNLGTIEDALEVIAMAGNRNVALLHCNSTYPAAQEDMNINAINTLKKCFNIPVGLSDHSFGLLVSTVALSIGADIIERHFTLNKSLEGPDHILSSEPDEMKRLVEVSMVVGDILGDGKKRVKYSEYDTINLQQKSIYALVDIKKGQKIDKDKLTIKGPSSGLLPKYLSVIEGRKATRDIQADCPITWSDV